MKKESTAAKTIVVNPELWKRARLKALQENRSLSAVIRDLLRDWTNKDKEKEPAAA